MILLVVACSSEEPAEQDVALDDAYTLSDDVDFPEGVAFDAASRAFFVGSLGHGGITRVDADGTETRVFEPDEDGWSTLGTKVQDGRVLFCAVRDASTADATSELWVLDPTSDDVDRYALAGGVTNCNDVVADGDDVYLTDRESSRVHRVDLSDGSAEVWLDHPELEPALIGNNGIVIAGDALLVGQYAPARLLRIPLSDPDSIAEVQLSGDEIGSLPNGADGITWLDDSLIIAANLRLARVSSDDDWATATVTGADNDVGIAAVTVAEGQLYGLKGEIVPYVLGTPESLPFQILALDAP